MHPPGARTVLVRYGEIGVKSARVQGRMEQRLAENVRATLDEAGFKLQESSEVHPGSDGQTSEFFEEEGRSKRRGGDRPLRVERERTRLYVNTSVGQIEQVTAAVTDVFGVVSASPSVTTSPTLDAIGEVFAETVASKAIPTLTDGDSIAVSARRAGPPSAHPFSSPDIEETGGSAILTAASEAGMDFTVDLDSPDHVFFVECREDKAYIFLEKRAGPGGLPLGCQEPLVALVSGGIDSPVAAWQAMRRGCPILPVYIDLGEYGGADHRARAIKSVNALEPFAPGHDLTGRVAPAGEVIAEIIQETNSHRMPVVRRLMYRIAEAVAANEGAVGIVTGESIGQKSSQTSATIRTTDAVTSRPVHRPLLTMDKNEITEQAKEIGTFDVSTVDAGCYRLAPDNPVTRPTLDAVRGAEPATIEKLVKSVVDTIELVAVE